MIVLNARAGVSGLAFSPDGSTLATGQAPGVRLFAWPPDGGKPRVLAGVRAWALAFTPDGRQLFTNGATGAGLVDPATGAVTAVGHGLRDGLNPPALLSPDGRSVVSAEWRYRPGQTNQISAWRTADPAVPAWRHQIAPGSRPVAFADADGVVTAEFDDTGAVFVSRRVSDGAVVGTTPRPAELGTHRAVSPDGRFLSSCHGAEIHVHRLAEFAAGPAVVRNPTGGAFAGVAFHPSGDYLVATTGGPAATVFDARTWRLVRTLDWAAGKLSCAAFSPDGAVCAAAGASGKVVAWDFDA